MDHIGTDVDKAARALRDGKLVAIPTETVYGLAVNALDEKAVLSLFEAKERPFFDPLIVHVHSVEQAMRYADFDDERLVELARRYWPGPLTLLLPKKEIIPGIVTSGLPRVGIRVPRHPLTLELLKKVDMPLAAPSANPFGYISPTLAEHVDKQLGNKVAYILDGGNCSIGIESTIAGMENGVPAIYRLGGLAVESIEKIAGRAVLRISAGSDPAAPGQLTQHYSPRKKIFLGKVAQRLAQHKEKKVALITFGPTSYQHPDLIRLNLSPSGDISEAALNLFRMLREADESQADLIIAEHVPQHGLGAAINDRLSRAAAM